MSEELLLTSEDVVDLNKAMNEINKEDSLNYTYGRGARYAGRPRDITKSRDWLAGWDDCDHHEIARGNPLATKNADE